MQQHHLDQSPDEGTISYLYTRHTQALHKGTQHGRRVMHGGERSAGLLQAARKEYTRYSGLKSKNADVDAERLDAHSVHR